MKKNQRKNAPVEKYRAPALSRGLDILEFLADQSLPLSQLEIARGLGLSPGELFRMLECLVARGYLMREPNSGGFHLTLKLYEVGHRQNATAMLRRAARQPMESFCERTGQSCHLSVQHGNSLLVLMERMPSRRICLAVGEGTVLPLAHTTSGLMILSRMGNGAPAFLDSDPVFQALSRVAQRGVLAAVAKSDSFRESKSLLSQGASDMAVAVGISGTDTAAVLASTFFTSPASPALRTEIQAAAQQINSNLGITI